MGQHPNTGRIRDGYAAFSRGDVAALAELFTKDVQWHEAGGAVAPLAGDYKGQEAVFAMFAQLPELCDRFEVTLVDCIADDHQAVSIHEVTARRGPHTYTCRESIVFHLLDGKVTDAWHTVPDVDAYDAFWADEGTGRGAEHPNVAAIRAGYDAYGRGDLDALRQSIAEDAVFHVRLGGRRDGDFGGREEVLAMLARTAEELGLVIELHDILANDSHATVLCRSTVTVDGEKHTTQDVHVYNLRDGRAVECWIATSHLPQSMARTAALEKRPTPELVRRGYDAFKVGDMAVLGELIAEDVEWRVPGSNVLSGTYSGRDEVFAFFARVFQETGGALELRIEDICCSEERTATLVTTTATRNGRTLTSRSLHLGRYRDGQLVEFCEYPDDQTVEDEFWA